MIVPLGDTYYMKFTTRNFSTGAPYTLAGTPVISVYEENNATQITAGITLTADYDSVTGLNNVAIVATSGNGYEVGKYYDVVITTGTVNSVSVVGEVVGSFRIGPAEAAAGIPDVNVLAWNDVLLTTTNPLPNAAAGAAGGLPTDSTGITAFNDISVADILNATIASYLTAGSLGEAIALGSAALVDSTITGTPTSTTFDFTGGSTTNGFYNDQLVYILSGTGIGQVRTILSSTYSGGTTTITVDEAYAVTPAASDRLAIIVTHVHPVTQIRDAILSDSTPFNGADIASILTDTGTTIPGVLGTPAGADMSTDIAAVKTDTTAILVDTGTTIPATLGTPVADIATDIAGVQADTDDIQTRIPAALVSGRMDSEVSSIGTSTTAATNLSASALGIVSTSVNDASATTTSFVTALTETTTDHYKGRIIVFTSGAVAGQATDITAYNGTTKAVTVTALTEAPANSVTFVIV